MTTALKLRWTEKYRGRWETNVVRPAADYVPWQGVVDYTRALDDYDVSIVTWTRNKGRRVGTFTTLAEAQSAAAEELAAVAKDG